MRIVMMNGGLGNQVFQYIFMRWIEEKTGEACIIDDLFFCHKNVQHNGYELDKVFSIAHPRLSEQLDKDTVNELLHRTSRFITEKEHRSDFITVFKACGIDLFPVQEADCFTSDTDYKGSVFSTPVNEYYPDILLCSGNIYYYGYWINGKWFDDIKDIILKELVFPPIPDEINRARMAEIQKAGDRSVAVHVRRGDFVEHGWSMPQAVYRRGLELIRSQINNPVYFVFSDDIPYVRENADKYGFKPDDNVTFVEGNVHGKNYIDMQLMSACRMIFLSGFSSFSYLAALLNRRKDRVVINLSERELF